MGQVDLAPADGHPRDNILDLVGLQEVAPDLVEAEVQVEDAVVVELKTIDVVTPIHEAQVRTYMRLTGCPIGLLINFGAPKLQIKKYVLSDIR